MRRVVGSWVVLVGMGLSVSIARAQSQPPPPAPCAASEFRQLDFWVGVWDVHWDASPGMAAGQGTNVVTREYGDCVIREEFDGGPTTGGLLGHSVSIYDSRVRRWRQTWVDNQGSYFSLDGGPEGDRFVLLSYDLEHRTPQGRMVFEKITPSGFTWRWQRTTDGGAHWTDSWVIDYRRRSTPASSK